MYTRQTDSLAVSAVSGADTLPSTPHRKSVYQVVRSLPASASPAQQDSAVQNYFRIEPLTWEDEDSWGPLPREAFEADTIAVPRFPTRMDAPLFRDLAFTIEETPYRPQGIAGDPLPYRFRTDDLVSSALLLSFFLVAWTIAYSWHSVKKSVREFFEPQRSGRLFSDKTEFAPRGLMFLVFQTCFSLGILFVDYTQEQLPAIFELLSPYLILCTATALCVAYYLLKISAYRLVNSVFFRRPECGLWLETYRLSVLVTGVFILAFTLLVVYFDLKYTTLVPAFCTALIVLKTLLAVKYRSIFFRYTGGLFHLFLYFCTLEAAPLFILWRVLIYANCYLTTIV